MSGRVWIVFLVFLLLAPLTEAKSKKKPQLPDYVLNAHTVLVVIHPEAGEPLADPTANRTAQDNVEKAMLKWGRFRFAMDPLSADLVITVRKGHAGGPAVSNSPVDNRPIIYEPTDGGVRVGAQGGRPLGLDYPSVGGPADKGPRIRNEIGPAEDMLEVYRGGTQYPLVASPVWRYMAHDALDGPEVAAVEQFQKAIDESEKLRQQKP
jgi:hypothetical protein